MKGPSSESGLAMIFAIISIVLLILLGAIMLFFTWQETNVETLTRFSQEAFFAAEAGLEDALAWIDYRDETPILNINNTTSREGRLSRAQTFNTIIQLFDTNIVSGTGVDTREYIFGINTTGTSRLNTQRAINVVASKIY